jgi:O-antigen/teichoic acid export membrane protein
LLILHTLYYGLARIVPGAINFLAIAVYTRLLSPEDYGVYAVVIALVGLGNVVLFQWIRLSLLRFFQANTENPEQFLSTIFLAFFLVALLSGCVGLALYIFWSDTVTRNLILVALPLLWATAWYQLNLELLRSRLEPGRYGLFAGVKAALALFCGTALVYLGFGAYGPLLGFLFGMLIVTVSLGHTSWRKISLTAPPLRALRPYLAYGMPLMATFAMAFVISSSDRLLIAWLLGKDAAGIYAAGYDLVAQVITLVMVTVNLAAYPLAIKVLERSGLETAKKQLVANGTLLLLVAVPVTCIFLILAPQIISILLGVQFHEGARALAPWIALSAFFAGIRAYHFDLVFQLSRKTIYQVWITGAAAVVNIVLNIILIPLLGTLGAAYATVIAYFVALILSIYWGKQLFTVSLLTVDSAKIAAAGVVLILSIWPLRHDFGIVSLLFQVSLAGLAYGAVILTTNVQDIRRKTFALLRVTHEK